MRLNVCLCCLLLLPGCAKGTASDPDGEPARDVQFGPDQTLAPDLILFTDGSPKDTLTPPDTRPSPDILAPADIPAHDAQVPDTLAPADSLAPADTQPPDTTQPPTDLCGPCGPGMTCGASGCICDPTTCSGCCASDGSACHPGNTAPLCGTNGAICQVCQTSDPCKLALCGSGQCQIAAHPIPPYPCPGAYGSPCGGTTGQVCLSGMSCATFVSGQTGFCTRYCSNDSDCTANKPSGSSPACNLSAGAQQACGFECFPGTCPSTMSCDFSEGICKP